MAKSKKAEEFEYRLTLAPHTNERRQQPTILLTIETTKAFASFRYELSIKELSEKRSLHFKILGLKAPQLSLPASGTAQFTREYDDLHGKYEITVERLDGKTNTFSVSITQKNIKILSSPKNPFIEVIVV